MSKSMIATAGGLSAADRENLIPANLRDGVTVAKVTGTLIPAKEMLTMGGGLLWRGGGGFYDYYCAISANSDYLDSVAGFREYTSGGSYVPTTINIPVKKDFTGHMERAVNVLKYEGAYVGTEPVQFKAGNNLQFVTASGANAFPLYKLLVDE